MIIRGIERERIFRSDFDRKVLRRREAGAGPLTFACDLERKENLLRVFEAALGAIPPASWHGRLGEIRTIMNERGFQFDHDDLTQIMSGELKRIPEDARSEGLIVSGSLLGDDGHQRVIGSLLAGELPNLDALWHVLAREYLGGAQYSSLLSELEAEGPNKVSEPATPYGGSAGKMIQRRLFD